MTVLSKLIKGILAKISLESSKICIKNRIVQKTLIKMVHQRPKKYNTIFLYSLLTKDKL